MFNVFAWKTLAPLNKHFGPVKMHNISRHIYRGSQQVSEETSGSNAMSGCSCILRFLHQFNGCRRQNCQHENKEAVPTAPFLILHIHITKHAGSLIPAACFHISQIVFNNSPYLSIRPYIHFNFQEAGALQRDIPA